MKIFFFQPTWSNIKNDTNIKTQGKNILLFYIDLVWKIENPDNIFLFLSKNGILD